MKKIVIASDHAGFDLKNALVKQLNSEGYAVEDVGTDSHESCDYPVFAEKACRFMLDGGAELCVLCCGTGIGISIAANKVKGIRCARVVSTDDSYAAKTHNHANAISLAADLEPTQALEIVNTFLHAAPSIEDRHVRRVNKIISYENGEYNEV